MEYREIQTFPSFPLPFPLTGRKAIQPQEISVLSNGGDALFHRRNSLSTIVIDLHLRVQPDTEYITFAPADVERHCGKCNKSLTEVEMDAGGSRQTK